MNQSQTSLETISDDSLVSNHIRGIPDIFSTTNSAITRSLMMKKRVQNGSQEMCISIEMQDQDLFCRICHGGNSSGDLLTPCRCRGSIALAHLRCLEIWLNESNRNDCELCQYHFRVIREPKYSVLWSVFVFLRHPGQHLREMLIDGITLIVYTPSTITSTYMLMLLCESISKSNVRFRKSFLSHVLAFTAIFGIATINFTYTSWLVLTLDKYVDYWKEWYKKTCSLRVVLSANKLVYRGNSNEPP